MGYVQGRDQGAIGRQRLLSVKREKDLMDYIKGCTELLGRRWRRREQLKAVMILAGEGDLGAGQDENPAKV